MATAGNKDLDDQNVGKSLSKKTRRSVVRSISWRRNKKTRMEENNEQTVEVTAEFDSGRVREIRTGSPALSDDEYEEPSGVDGAEPSSKKRKRFGVWKAMKKMFRKRSNKGSKSFTEGDANSPHAQPQRSISDPNLISSADRPELAPLEQVDGSPVNTEAESPSPKKALSHDNLMSELRMKQGKSFDDEKQASSNRKKKPVIDTPEAKVVNWNTSPSSAPEGLVPGLNVSYDKIRVAPRHRRAPSRRGVSSVRHAGSDVADGNFVPRSNSVGSTPPSHQVITPQKTEFRELMQSLRSSEEEKKPFPVKLKEMEVNMKESIPEQPEKTTNIELVSEDDVIDEADESTIHTVLDTKVIERQNNDTEDKTFALEVPLEKEEIAGENGEKDLTSPDHPPILLDSESVAVSSSEQMLVSPGEAVAPAGGTANHKPRDDVVTNNEPAPDTYDASAVEVNIEVDHVVDHKPEDSLSLSPVPRTSRTLDAGEVVLVDREPEVHSAVHSVTSTQQVSDLEVTPFVNNEFETGSDVDHKGSSQQLLDADHIKPDADHIIPSEKMLEQSSNDEPAVEVVSESDSVELVRPDPELVPVTTSEVVITEYNDDVFHPVEAPSESVPKESSEVVEVTSQSHVSVESGLKPLTFHASDTSSILPSSEKAIQESKPAESMSTEAVAPRSVRSKRLTVEAPEKVYQKPIMEGLRTEEVKEGESEESSIYDPTMTRTEEQPSKDDSSAGVAKLTRVFERTSRCHTISYIDRRKKPDVPPKPKIVGGKTDKAQAVNNQKTRSLGRNYRFPVSDQKSLDMSSDENKKTNVNENNTMGKTNQDTLEHADISEKTETVLMSPTRKHGSAPKPLPKPKIKREDRLEVGDKNKENVKGDPVVKPVRNGSTRLSESESVNGKVNSASDSSSEVTMPSFWARRNMFTSNTPDGKSSKDQTSPGSPEKGKPKHVPFIPLKTDTCAVCGSKVYQMEKFKVKDNIVHRSCIKCSVCKRLLSVGNFIMSQNKIYCKPHEPSITIALAT